MEKIKLIEIEITVSGSYEVEDISEENAIEKAVYELRHGLFDVSCLEVTAEKIKR